MALWDEILFGGGAIGILVAIILIVVLLMIAIAPIGIWFSLSRLARAHQQIADDLTGSAKRSPGPTPQLENVAAPSAVNEEPTEPREPFDWTKKSGPLRNYEWAALLGLAALISGIGIWLFGQ